MVSIAWDESKAKSEEMIANAAPFNEHMLDDFAVRRGVYCFIYSGDQLGSGLWNKPDARIIYIGHTGDDSVRHWKNNTGFSTIRRSLAAMLAGVLHLNAIPRSADPEDTDRFANYKLDETSELRLTAWMKENIQIAFFDLEENEIEDWFNALIDYNTPMFVFQNNPNNNYGAQIKLYRAKLAEQAARV